ncbi:MAG TPA: indole-3-glycerol phosphate synthase TrpC [Terriglobales bacterium]|nr:indole-3-glycerol phosphate synthase TrpC [Terriglobales bacterium]
MAMVRTLDEITAATRRRILDAQQSWDRRHLEGLAEKHRPRGFRHRLQARSQTGPAVIAELKKASPSRGLIRPDFDPRSLAIELEHAGAAALSVLTNEEFFRGSLENLRCASASTELPCLRKDFILDEMQVLEARAHKADAVLLIVAALSQAELERLARRAGEYLLDVLCEVHNREEVQRAIDAGCNLIGVNNRDLQTFRVDLGTALRLADLLPPEAVRVAESGIHSGAEIARLQDAGYQAVLIGESLMLEKSPGTALQALLAEARSPGTVHREADRA